MFSCGLGRCHIHACEMLVTSSATVRCVRMLCSLPVPSGLVANIVIKIIFPLGLAWRSIPIGKIRWKREFSQNTSFNRARHTTNIELLQHVVRLASGEAAHQNLIWPKSIGLRWRCALQCPSRSKLYCTCMCSPNPTIEKTYAHVFPQFQTNSKKMEKTMHRSFQGDFIEFSPNFMGLRTSFILVNNQHHAVACSRTMSTFISTSASILLFRKIFN